MAWLVIMLPIFKVGVACMASEKVAVTTTVLLFFTIPSSSLCSKTNVGEVVSIWKVRLVVPALLLPAKSEADTVTV